MTRPVGMIEFQIGDRIGSTTVIFGEEKDALPLGVTGLEELALQVDPASGDLKPMENLLLTIGP